MAFELRKKRTRQHVIADISVHHLEGFILNEGHTTQRLTSDYSYDLIMRTFDDAGFVEQGVVYFQLKASDSLETNGSSYAYDLDIRDYNLWMREEMPVILVLFDAARKKAVWLCVQLYFEADAARQPKKGAKSIRVRVSIRQTVNRSAIQKMRELKRLMERPTLGVIS